MVRSVGFKRVKDRMSQWAGGTTALLFGKINGPTWPPRLAATQVRALNPGKRSERSLLYYAPSTLTNGRAL